MNSTELPPQDRSGDGPAPTPPRPTLLRPLELAAVGLYAFASQPDVTRFEEKDFLSQLQQHEVDIKQAMEQARRDFLLAKLYPPPGGPETNRAADRPESNGKDTD